MQHDIDNDANINPDEGNWGDRTALAHIIRNHRGLCHTLRVRGAKAQVAHAPVAP
jgi:hypothetical protein